MGRSRKHIVLNRILFLLNILAIIALFLAYVAPEVSPQTIWFLALFGLMYPYLLMINLLFVIWWALSRKLLIIYPLLAIVLGWGYPGRYVQFNKPSGKEMGSGDMKITTWNVQNLAMNNIYLDKPGIRKNIFRCYKNIFLCMRILISYFHCMYSQLSI